MKSNAGVNWNNAVAAQQLQIIYQLYWLFNHTDPIAVHERFRA